MFVVAIVYYILLTQNMWEKTPLNMEQKTKRVWQTMKAQILEIRKMLISIVWQEDSNTVLVFVVT